MTRTVLQVIPELSAGGAERTTIEVAEALHKRGDRALVASEGGRLERELAAVGGELFVMPLKTKNPLEAWRNAARIEKLAIEQKVDLIHARSRAPAWSAYLAARRLKVPFVTTYHGVYNAKSPLKRFYNSIMARGDLVIANSAFTAVHLVKEHKIAPEKVTVILRGVDLEKFDPAAVSDERVAKIRAHWGISVDDERPILVLAARLTRWKGQALAIEAAAALRKAGFPAFNLVLIGDAQGRVGFEVELKQLIQSAGLAGDVHLPGHCADMAAAFKAASIVLQPSLEPEAFGRSAAEAQAMGKPVIAAGHGGLVEVIEDGVTGLLTTPGDVASLAAAIRQLLSLSHGDFLAMGANAALRARKLFAKEILQESTMEVYSRLLGANK